MFVFSCYLILITINFVSSNVDFLKTVSNDGKKVKRKQPFTDKDKEELQVNEC